MAKAIEKLEAEHAHGFACHCLNRVRQFQGHSKTRTVGEVPTMLAHGEEPAKQQFRRVIGHSRNLFYILGVSWMYPTNQLTHCSTTSSNPKPDIANNIARQPANHELCWLAVHLGGQEKKAAAEGGGQEEGKRTSVKQLWSFQLCSACKPFMQVPSGCKPFSNTAAAVPRFRLRSAGSVWVPWFRFRGSVSAVPVQFRFCGSAVPSPRFRSSSGSAVPWFRFCGSGSVPVPRFRGSGSAVPWFRFCGSGSVPVPRFLVPQLDADSAVPAPQFHGSTVPVLWFRGSGSAAPVVPGPRFRFRGWLALRFHISTLQDFAFLMFCGSTVLWSVSIFVPFRGHGSVVLRFRGSVVPPASSVGCGVFPGSADLRFRFHGSVVPRACAAASLPQHAPDRRGSLVGPC